ncbi:MAG: hypothetical protein M0000_04095 [Actinomycetota bacterium]|nr:hypothetical protein [Actinomycetota bacterium]
MNELVSYRSQPLQRVVDALSGAIEVERDPAFGRLRDACERRMVLDALRTPPWWQADPGRYQSELESARALLESADVQMVVRILRDGALAFEGVLRLSGGEQRQACAWLPRTFPEHAPEVRLLAGPDEWLVLPLQLQKVWRSDMDCDFALRAAIDLIEEGVRHGRKGRT